MSYNMNSILDFSFLNTLHQFDSIYPYLRNNTLISSITSDNLNAYRDVNSYSFQNILSNGGEDILLGAPTDASTKTVLSENGKKQLKIIKYTSECKNAVCPITQTQFKENEEITQLQCKHCFESESIYKWLTKEKAACPVCRYNLDSVIVNSKTNELVDDQRQYNNMGLDQYYNTYIEEILRRYCD